MLAAAAALGFVPRECVYVGDDGKDVAAAFAAGMRSIVALYGYSSMLGAPGLQCADAKIDTLEGLPKVLERMGCERTLS